MRLIEFRVERFRNIIDSGPVHVDDEVTCLVGKNESGKTAFLQALQLLNPDRPNTKLSAAKMYPAWLEKKHRRTADLEKFQLVSGTFEFDRKELSRLEGRFGQDQIHALTFRVRAGIRLHPRR